MAEITIRNKIKKEKGGGEDVNLDEEYFKKRVSYIK